MFVCVTINYFAAAVEQRDDDGLRDHSLVIGGPPWETQPLFAFSSRVAQRGVRPGMSLRRAHFLSPQAYFLPTARARYEETGALVAQMLAETTPRLELLHLWPPEAGLGQQTIPGRRLPARFLLDLEGLPQKETVPLVRDVGRSLRETTLLAPAIGVAGDRFTAQVAAALSRPHHALPVAPGKEAGFLADRPVSFLALAPATRRRLRLLGLRTLGQLARLPPHSLPTQFGYESAQLMAPALRPLRESDGGPPELAIPAVDPAHTVSAGRRLPGGVTERSILQETIQLLAVDLAADLAAAGRAGAELRLWWQTESGSGEETLTLRRPAADVQTLAGVGAELLGRAPIGEPVEMIALQLDRLQPATAHQPSLFDMAQRSRQALRDLTAKYGATCFQQPRSDQPNHPLPERRFRLQPLFGAG